MPDGHPDWQAIDASTLQTAEYAQPGVQHGAKNKYPDPSMGALQQGLSQNSVQGSGYKLGHAVGAFNSNRRKLDFWRYALVGLGILAGILALFLAAVYGLGRL